MVSANRMNYKVANFNGVITTCFFYFLSFFTCLFLFYLFKVLPKMQSCQGCLISYLFTPRRVQHSLTSRASPMHSVIIRNRNRLDLWSVGSGKEVQLKEGGACDSRRMRSQQGTDLEWNHQARSSTNCVSTPGSWPCEVRNVSTPSPWGIQDLDSKI